MTWGYVGQLFKTFNPVKQNQDIIKGRYQSIWLPTLPDTLVCEYVKVGKFDLLLSQQCYHSAGEPASRCVRTALHEQHDFALVHELVKPLLQRVGCLCIFATRY
jgi:hypothetical protein